jgi:hypothetical protein
MAKSGRDQSKIAEFLKNLQALIASLPSEEEKQQLQHMFESLQAFVTEVRNWVASLPTKEENNATVQALNQLPELLSRAEANPAMAAMLGLRKAAPARRRASTVRSDPERIKTLLTEMEGLSTEDVRKRLIDKTFPLGELRGLASELGVASAGKLSRENLAQQVAPKVVNYRSYWRLGRE